MIHTRACAPGRMRMTYAWSLRASAADSFTLSTSGAGSADSASRPALVISTIVVAGCRDFAASPRLRNVRSSNAAASSYLVVAALQQQIESGAHLSVLWQFVPYLILFATAVLAGKALLTRPRTQASEPASAQRTTVLFAAQFLDVVEGFDQRRLVRRQDGERIGAEARVAVNRKWAADTEANLQRIFFERGWTDGLPIILPTEERVAEMLAGTRQPPDKLAGKAFLVDTQENLRIAVETVAIAAVMAGAKPENKSGGCCCGAHAVK